MGRLGTIFYFGSKLLLESHTHALDIEKTLVLIGAILYCHSLTGDNKNHQRSKLFLTFIKSGGRCFGPLRSRYIPVVQKMYQFAQSLCTAQQLKICNTLSDKRKYGEHKIKDKFKIIYFCIFKFIMHGKSIIAFI